MGGPFCFCQWEPRFHPGWGSLGQDLCSHECPALGVTSVLRVVLGPAVEHLLHIRCLSGYGDELLLCRSVVCAVCQLNWRSQLGWADPSADWRLPGSSLD